MTVNHILLVILQDASIQFKVQIKGLTWLIK